jgi:hypothetical protein
MYVLRRKSTGEILKRQENCPRPDGKPVKGLDDDLEWLEATEGTKPSYDPLRQKLSRSGSKVLDKWEWTWAAVDLTEEDQRRNVQSKAKAEFSERQSAVYGVQEMIGCLCVVSTLSAKESLTAEEQAQLTSCQEKVKTVADAHVYLEQLEAAIAADVSVDPTVGWPE